MTRLLQQGILSAQYSTVLVDGTVTCSRSLKMHCYWAHTLIVQAEIANIHSAPKVQHDKRVTTDQNEFAPGDSVYAKPSHNHTQAWHYGEIIRQDGPWLHPSQTPNSKICRNHRHLCPAMPQALQQQHTFKPDEPSKNSNAQPNEELSAHFCSRMFALLTNCKHHQQTSKTLLWHQQQLNCSSIIRVGTDRDICKLHVQVVMSRSQNCDSADFT